MDEQDFLEDLINMVKILTEEPDKLELVQKQGAKIVKNLFIFTCLGGCDLTYGIDYINREVYLLNDQDAMPEAGAVVEDQEEITCVIESLLDFVNNALDVKGDWHFMQRLNPKNYTPGSCFSRC